MLHSGSRGIGGKIGSTYIRLAKEEMERWFIDLPDRDLACLPERSERFGEYMGAANWAQRFEKLNRELMLAAVVDAVDSVDGVPPFELEPETDVDCHHNYVAREHHYRQPLRGPIERLSD